MQRQIYPTVREAGAMSVDELTERLHISSREAALSLTKLELSGFVERITGGRFEVNKKIVLQYRWINARINVEMR